MFYNILVHTIATMMRFCGFRVGGNLINGDHITFTPLVL